MQVTDGDTFAHAAYAPLENAMFRATVCDACLMVWAREAYEVGDDMPDWVRRIRSGMFG